MVEYIGHNLNVQRIPLMKKVNHYFSILLPNVGPYHPLLESEKTYYVTYEFASRFF